jgi:hypothetical protein
LKWSQVLQCFCGPVRPLSVPIQKTSLLLAMVIFFCN